MNFIVCLTIAQRNSLKISRRYQQNFIFLSSLPFNLKVPFSLVLIQKLLLLTASYIDQIMSKAYAQRFLSKSHLGLSGTFFLIKHKEKMPSNPIKNIILQCSVYPTIEVSIEARVPPRCQVPSIPMLTLPRYCGGINSSIAVKMAVNYPPTLN